MNNLAQQLLFEDKGGKNLHLEHIEDEILNYGITGGRASINFVQSLRDMFAGASRSSINMTVKWDGAPAVFAGVDPEDGKFFVGKKSVFNVEPQLYKTNADVDKYTSGDLNKKLKVALSEFSKLGIKGVLQGDLMFTDDVSTDTIDGKKYYTFQPNTIVYAVDVDSDYRKQIKKAKIGVVWHTTYTGNELQSMKASFGVNISGLKNVSSVWQDDATFKDVSGSGNNWAHGHCVYGPKYHDKIYNAVRQATELCDSLQSFFFIHSLGGGTDSGLGTYILKMDPAAKSVPHIHQGFEEFYVIEGELEDADGKVFKKGDFITFEPGTTHNSHTKNGCLLIVFMRGINKPI